MCYLKDSRFVEKVLKETITRTKTKVDFNKWQLKIYTVPTQDWIKLKNGVVERTLDWKPGDLSSSPTTLLCDFG